MTKKRLWWHIKQHRAVWMSIPLVSLVISAALFKIERVPYFASCAASMTLTRNTVVENKIIYPTELVSVDTADKSATIRVKLPEEGWKEFTGREKEVFEGIGYGLESVFENEVVILVPYPKTGYHYHVASRWH